MRCRMGHWFPALLSCLLSPLTGAALSAAQQRQAAAVVTAANKNVK